MQTEVDSYDSENSEINAVGFIDYVSNHDRRNLSEMLALRVIPSFILSMRRHKMKVFSEDTLKLWLVDMIIDRHKESTIRRYLGAMHTFYKEFLIHNNIAVQTVSFSLNFSGIYSEKTPKALKEIDSNLRATLNLFKGSLKTDSSVYIYNKAFQYLLFNPFASLRDVVELKYSDPLPDNMHIEDIVTSMRKAPQSKYVFPLLQGKRRQPAIIKSMLSELHTTGKRAGMIFGDTFSRESITELWIAAAVKEGIPYSEIVAMINNLPPIYSFLSLVPSKAVSEERKLEIINIVADSITNKTPGWFVLRMRSGVNPDDIKYRLSEKGSALRRMITYYYPQRVVKKMVKKKMVSKEVPVIPGILFFRLPYDRVNPLISIIGDLAWCYRTSTKPSSPYSVIAQSEMIVFQKCVGEYTSDIEIDIISSLPPLAVGDEVVIENGSMLDGQQATIRKVRSVNGKLTYTLRLSDTAFIRWEEINLPPSNLAKVKD